ncbi:MAG TPA: hypothetical protein VFO89_10190, partial [Thermoanaerobaculia bacterium]|nr:hypothetical protein [Thermoanaerobaculia bacterium]
MSSSPGNETVPSVTLRTGTPWGKEQTPSARAAMQFQEIVARATPETVRSGILDTLPPRLLPLRELNGSEDSPVVSQDEWQRCLEALLRGRLPDAASATPASSLITIDEIDARAAAHHARGHVPIFIGVFEYHALRGRAWVMIERAAQEAALAGDAAGSPATSDLFEPRRCFLASAVLPALYAGFTTLPYAHRGRRVSFVLPSDTLLGSAPELTDLTIDFGDGRGPRSMKRDEPVTITYGEAGPKIVTVTGRDREGSRTAHFRITL